MINSVIVRTDHLAVRDCTGNNTGTTDMCTKFYFFLNSLENLRQNNFQGNSEIIFPQLALAAE